MVLPTSIPTSGAGPASTTTPLVPPFPVPPLPVPPLPAPPLAGTPPLPEVPPLASCPPPSPPWPGPASIFMLLPTNSAVSPPQPSRPRLNINHQRRREGFIDIMRLAPPKFFPSCLRSWRSLSKNSSSFQHVEITLVRAASRTRGR